MVSNESLTPTEIKEEFDKKQKERRKVSLMKATNIKELSNADYDTYNNLIIKIMQDKKVTKKDIVAFDKLKKDLGIRIIAADVFREI